MKNPRWWMIAGGIVACPVALVLWLGRGSGIEIPPPLTPDQVRAAPAERVVPLVTADLRLAITVGRAWRSLPPPARHVYAISWVQSDPGAGGNPPTGGFSGFRSFMARSGPQVPTPAEIAEAYAAIGAPAVAPVMNDAQRIAVESGQDPQGPDPFTRANREFLDACDRAGTKVLLRTYVQTHADEIALGR